MSGDVQPRRRKDKRKKKEEQSEETIVHPLPPPTPTLTNDDTNIHIHKERTLGGGICAKCVFFLFMIVISVIIGFTITEHRGQTDVDIPVTESRFASIFEGWTDKSLDEHDEDEIHDVHDQLEDSQEEEEEEIEGSEEPEETSEEEVELNESEEVGEPEEESQEEEDEDEAIESQEVDDEEDEQEEDVEEDQTIESEETEEDIAAEESEIQEMSDEEQEEGPEDVDDQHEEYEAQSEDEEEREDLIEITETGADKDEPEEDVDLQDEETENEDGDGEEDENPDLSTANRNANFKIAAVYVAVAVKVGVGLSLFIVAYIVLVKKWKSDKIEEDAIKEEPTPDMSRRNTFVPPPTLEEVEQDIENLEEEYSNEEQEDSDEERTTMPASRRQYEELRSTYHRTSTPDSEPEYTQQKYEDSENESDEYEDHERRHEHEEEEMEEEEEEEREYEDDEDYDEELMKKLEARYGRLDDKSSRREQMEDDEDEDEDFRSWKRIKSDKNAADFNTDNDKPLEVLPKTESGAQGAYEFENITNPYDYEYKDDLDEAQRHIDNNVQLALNLFTNILDSHPNSPRGLYGKAKVLDLLAEERRSNEILQESIQHYLKVLEAEQVPNVLFLEAGERCINRMRFIGNYGRAISVHKKLIDRFHDESKYRNDLAVTYLTINRIPEARLLLTEILRRWPNDGFALVHYGFILKTVDNELNRAIDYLRKGIQTRDPGVIDGRFYFHLGDALARLGRRDEAMQVYEDGVKNKVFLSKYQRSLYNVKRLKARPWWEKEETPYANLYRQLEQNYKKIREEALGVLNLQGYFKDESENLRDVGDWKQFELYARGIKHAHNCKKCPITCKIIDSEPDAKSCKRGQVKFSVMHPGTHVWPHCGPTNCRLRVHLGLKVPSGTYIRVAEETRSWKEGKVFVFDDSFEHEVWHNGTEFRLVLIVDVWHPQLTKTERYNLSAI